MSEPSSDMEDNIRTAVEEIAAVSEPTRVAEVASVTFANESIAEGIVEEIPVVTAPLQNDSITQETNAVSTTRLGSLTADVSSVAGRMLSSITEISDDNNQTFDIDETEINKSSIMSTCLQNIQDTLRGNNSTWLMNFLDPTISGYTIPRCPKSVERCRFHISHRISFTTVQCFMVT